jgi:hypothetical protein
MATTVTTLNYLTSTKAGNTLRDNGGYVALSYTPSAAVSENYSVFNSDGTFAPQGGSSDLTVVTGLWIGRRRWRSKNCNKRFKSWFTS